MQHNLTRAVTDDIEENYQAALDSLAAAHARYQAAPLPHMLLAEKSDDIAAMHGLADALADGLTDGVGRILILGTGGSSLGAQVLAQVHGALTPAGQLSGPQLIFVDNLDAETYARLLQGNLADTRFLVVSKSGGTAETLRPAANECAR